MSNFSKTAIGHRHLPQQHGSLAALNRAHPEYHEDTLVARAWVLATRWLLPKSTEDEQLLVRVMKTIAQLAQQKPDRIKGRQAYLPALPRHAGGNRKCDPRMPTTRAIVQVYGGLRNKGASERGGGEKEANRMAICQKNMIDAHDEVQKETLRLCDRISGRVAGRRQMSIAEAAFTPAMMVRSNMEFATFQHHKRLGSCPKDSRRCSAVPFACSAREAPRGGRFRLRVKRRAARRWSFANTAFVVDRGSEGVSLWKFVYDVQAPVCVRLCRMVQIPPFLREARWVCLCADTTPVAHVAWVCDSWLGGLSVSGRIFLKSLRGNWPGGCWHSSDRTVRLRVLRWQRRGRVSCSPRGRTRHGR